MRGSAVVEKESICLDSEKPVFHFDASDLDTTVPGPSTFVPLSDQFACSVVTNPGIRNKLPVASSSRLHVRSRKSVTQVPLTDGRHREKKRMPILLRLLGWVMKPRADLISARRPYINGTERRKAWQSMSTAEKYHPNNPHIPLMALWQCRTDKRVLTTEEIVHIVECPDCLALLGICHLAQSIMDVERRVYEVGI